MNPDESGRCYHCSEGIATKPAAKEIFSGKTRSFCCHGCLGACRIIHDAGQSSYYQLRELPQSGIGPVNEISDKRTNQFNGYNHPAVLNQVTSPGEAGFRELVLQISGIHCQSCVVLNERVLEKLPGIARVAVQYDSGRCEIGFNPKKVKISDILHQIYSIGYSADIIAPGMQLQSLRKEVKGLLWNLAVSAFVAGNVMTLSFALWSGYFDGSMSIKFKGLFQWLEFLLTTPVFFYCARTFHNGWRSFLKTGLPGMNVLISSGISAAYFYSVYAFFTGHGEIYFDSVSMIVFFLLVGRYLEWRARLKQRERMEGLVKPLPLTANVLSGQNRNVSQFVVTPVIQLRAEDIILLEPGDTLPCDGILLDLALYSSKNSEICEMDEAILTGESLPVKRQAGDHMLAGSILVAGRAVVKLNGTLQQSGMAALGRLAQGVDQEKSNYERKTQALIPWFSGLIFLVSILSFVVHFFYFGADLEQSLIVVVAILIVSCPCALALAVPTVTSAALFVSVKRGVLFKDGQVLQKFSMIKQFFFDKTGTLTCGKPVVTDLKLSGKEQVIYSMIYRMESGNYHPVGQSLLEFARLKMQSADYLVDQMDDTIPDYTAGNGIQYSTQNKIWRLGNIEFACNSQKDINLEKFIQLNLEATIVVLSVDYKNIAMFALEDRPRAETAKTIRRLRREKYSLKMLTGDNERAALYVASQTGILDSEINAKLHPVDKLQFIIDYKQKHKADSYIAMVGDGYNDAPALAKADISIVLARGAPLSINHAGVILLTNNLTQLFTAIDIARSAMRTIRFNLSISFFYNVVMISIAAMGYLLPIWCALAMALSSLSVIASSAIFRIRTSKQLSGSGF